MKGLSKTSSISNISAVWFSLITFTEPTRENGFVCVQENSACWTVKTYFCNDSFHLYDRSYFCHNNVLEKISKTDIWKVAYTMAICESFSSCSIWQSSFKSWVPTFASDECQFDTPKKLSFSSVNKPPNNSGLVNKVWLNLEWRIH